MERGFSFYREELKNNRKLNNKSRDGKHNSTEEANEIIP